MTKLSLFFILASFSLGVLGEFGHHHDVEKSELCTFCTLSSEKKTELLDIPQNEISLSKSTFVKDIIFHEIKAYLFRIDLEFFHERGPPHLSLS